MKFILIGAAAAVKLSGIDYEALHEGAHWKKAWPEGAIDDGSDDSEVLDRFLAPKEKEPDVPAHVWYEYEPHTVTKQNEFQGIYH